MTMMPLVVRCSSFTFNVAVIMILESVTCHMYVVTGRTKNDVRNTLELTCSWRIHSSDNIFVTSTNLVSPSDSPHKLELGVGILSLYHRLLRMAFLGKHGNICYVIQQAL